MDDKEGMGINGAVFQNELLLLDGMNKKRIQVWINSPGGIVMDGYNIYIAILKSKTKVDTYCVGIAASIAAVIFQAGRNRVMSDYSCLMYHDPFGGSSKELDVMKDSLATMISTRSGKTTDEILSVMKKTTWINAEEAKMDGFCDEIEASNDHNKQRAKTVSNGAMSLYAVSNSILSEKFTIKTTKMTKVANKLGLNPDANEDSILAGIAAIENSAKAKDKTISEMEDAYKAKEKELADMKNALDAANKKAEDSEAEKKAAEENAEGEKCKNMISDFAKIGKIKNDAETIAKWEGTAKKLGFEEAKNLLEALPLNKVANKLPEPGNLAEGEVPTTAVNLMAKIQNNLKK